MPIIEGPFQLPNSEIEPLLLGGRARVGLGQALDVFDPSNGARIGQVSTVSTAEVGEVLRNAKAARIKSGWAELQPHKRARVLGKAADIIESQASFLAELQRLENGKTRKESLAQALAAAASVRYYSAVCECGDEDMPPPRGDYITLTVYEPYGVVAALTPWNSPLTMGAQKIAPALGGGNAVVLKAAETTSFVTLALAQCVVEAGLPEGLLSVISGGAAVGRALVEDPNVDFISFTGGTSTGQAIARGASDRLVPMILELGGKSAHIIFADADLPAAAKAVASGIFGGTGQSCVAGSRLFVEDSVRGAFKQLLVEATNLMKVGSPRDDATALGPLASFAQRERVEHYVSQAVQDGGRVVIGGHRPDEPALESGAYFLPTIIEGLSNQSRVAQEEIFGPVLCLLPFSHEDELIAAANDSIFGLAAGIWTADYKKAWRVARRLEAGTVWVNTYKELSIAAPFGGFKLSGLGREKGLQGLRAYQQMKSIYLAT
jgi:acyl-CoA reductase-like NAD-dependent aldehyde dehydrogenase